MKRVLLLAVVAMGLPVVPAGANPAASVEVVDNIHFGYFGNNESAGIGANIYITRTQEAAPAAAPGNIFPITIDPNNPPEPPVSATESTYTVSGWVQICVPSNCTISEPISIDEDDVTIEEIPLPGNALRLQLSLTMVDWMYQEYPLTFDVRGVRPSSNSLTPGIPSDFNAWTDGPTTHASSQGAPLSHFRGAYEVTGSATSSFAGDFDLSEDYVNLYFHRQIRYAGSVDV